MNYWPASESKSSIDQILGEVYFGYGDLMKFTAYHLGNLRGLGRQLSEMPRNTEALEGHWFTGSHPFSPAMTMRKDISKDYGKWTDKAAFEVVGDLADACLLRAEFTTRAGPTGVGHRHPGTAETMPSEADAVRLSAT